MGMTPEQFWHGEFDPNVVRARKNYGDYSRENFDKWQREVIYPCFEPFYEGEPNTFCVANEDFSSNEGIKKIQELLELSSDKEIDMKAIEKVQMDRFARMKQ